MLAKWQLTEVFICWKAHSPSSSYLTLCYLNIFLFYKSCYVSMVIFSFLGLLLWGWNVWGSPVLRKRFMKWVLDCYLLLYYMLVHRIDFANLKQIKEITEFQNMQYINCVKHLNQAPFSLFFWSLQESIFLLARKHKALFLWNWVLAESMCFSKRKWAFL